MTDEATSPKENQIAMADYIEDMQAVEIHIKEALRRQLSMFGDQPNIRAAVGDFHDMAKEHRDVLAKLLEDLPKEPVGNSVKNVGSAVLGKAAGLIDKVRTESNAKTLRDDYTAFSLATVSYGMLHATAVGLGDNQVAEIADEHLRGYAAATQRIMSLIPEAVAHDLEHDGLQLEGGAVEQSRAAIEKAWKEATA